MTEQPHITLEMENNSRQQMQNLTDKNDHELDLYSSSDVDAIDGHIPRIPKAIPETDDDDEYDDRPSITGPHTGVDDGLLPDDDANGIVPNHNPVRPPSRRPSMPFPDYRGTGDDTPTPDINAYQQKKTLAQGMMDLALLSANANQLRYVLESYQRHPYYYASLVFISISIIFQIAVGVGLILNGRYNVINRREICRANKINNYTVIGIFIVTVVNVFISAFGVAELQADRNA